MTQFNENIYSASVNETADSASETNSFSFVSDAHRSDVIWSNRIASFSTISMLTGGSLPSYTKVLQMFLCSYDNSWAQIISHAGGIDGYFGNATRQCVESFQQIHGLQVDGIVGWNTWHKIGECLYDTIGTNGYIIFSVNSNWIFRSTVTAPYKFYYAALEYGNPTWIYFHTTNV